jgi:hypothetical protein
MFPAMVPSPSVTSTLFDFWGIDSVTIIVALVAMILLACVRRWHGISPVFTRRRIINDFLHAGVIYPFVLLVVSVPDSGVFEYLKGSRLVVGLAGVVGVIFVVGELIASSSPPKSHD